MSKAHSNYDYDDILKEVNWGMATWQAYSATKHVAQWSSKLIQYSSRVIIIIIIIITVH